ncbi:MAG: DUF512 domain-containing protein, partial [Coriobacteriales bacterium]|nr:DUF512 domain-containing protein [Coriobacteriales bacterium]
FVTLTNLSDYEIKRIIHQRLSPLHISLHAIDDSVRRQMMGKHAHQGLYALRKLLTAGIEAHVQIVLRPDVNDGVILTETLQWLTDQPGILSTGIVPYAFTQYARDSRSSIEQTAGSPSGVLTAGCPSGVLTAGSPAQVSFSPDQAAVLIEELSALAPSVQLADEWFILAGQPLPEAEYYNDFPQYENGIGMVRSFIDEWQSIDQQRSALPTLLATGTAFAPILNLLIAQSPWATDLEVLPVVNRFFGGSVNVAGLMTATDLFNTMKTYQASKNQLGLQDKPLALPAAAFNTDGLTLDGYTIDAIASQLELPIHMVTCFDELFYLPEARV